MIHNAVGSSPTASSSVDQGASTTGLDFGCLDTLALFAHQFLTPLAVIEGSAQRLIRHSGEDNAEVTERARRIRAAAQELISLARRLLDQVRPGEREGGSIACSLNDIVRAAHDHVRASDPERDILVDISQAAENIQGNPELLKQMMSILLCNAAKYSAPEKLIRITAFGSSGKVVVSVHDEGIGVPEREIEKIFEPFYRAHNATSKDGLGLGLCLAQRIARLHGGEITARPAAGGGSVFSIILPLSSDRAHVKNRRSRMA